MLLGGEGDGDDVQMDTPEYLKIYPKTAASPERHPIPRDRATASSPTHTASPAKERASPPTSASDDFSKLPSRIRQVL